MPESGGEKRLEENRVSVPLTWAGPICGETQ